MSGEETKRLERKLDDILAEMKSTNGRVSQLELWKARQEGKESVVSGTSINWQPILLSLAKALGIAIGLAYLLAEALLK